MSGKPVIACVSGVKNSGKTTLMEKLIRELRSRGLQVAAIKHDGHDFTPDVPGTDSYRFGQAGACGYAIYSPQRYLLVRQTKTDERDFLDAFPEADVILLEGFKDSGYPKLEVVRGGNSFRPVCDPATLLAVCTDLDLHLDGVPTLGLDDVERMADLILEQSGQTYSTDG
jgi:molybdopterin-guanine dinucleotide biosynthesis protein B